MESTQKSKSGGVLVEFVIALPLLLILMAFLVNIASFIWEIEILNDAVRYGARAGQHSCNGIEATALAATDDYQKARLAAPLTHYKRWATPVSELRDESLEISYSDCVSKPEDCNVPIGVLSVEVPLPKSSNQCFFCLDNVFMSLNPAVKANHLLEATCAVAGGMATNTPTATPTVAPTMTPID